MKKYLVLLLFFPLHGRAQDYTLRELLGEETPDCEEVADSLSGSIASLNFFSDEDPIYLLMKQWENICGFTEPHFRIQTLYLIKNGNLHDSILPEDVLDFIYRYLDRIKDAQRDNYREIYSYNRAYYDFVPLKSPLDRWTRQVADSLLQQSPTNALSRYFLELYANPSHSDFEKNTFAETYDSLPLALDIRDIEYRRHHRAGEFGLNTGYWYPLGPQSQYLGNTLTFGLEYGSRFNERWRGDIGLQLRIPRNLKDFRVNVVDSTAAASNQISGCLYFRTSRKLWASRNFYISGLISAGLDFTVTDAEVITYDPEEGNSVHDLTLYTYNFALGTEMGFSVFRWHQTGLQFSYHLMDYGWGVKSVSDLSGHGFSAALFYRF